MLACKTNLTMPYKVNSFRIQTQRLQRLGKQLKSKFIYRRKWGAGLVVLFMFSGSSELVTYGFY